MKLDVLVNAIEGVVVNRNLNREIVVDSLKEAITKAFRKQINVSDALVSIVEEDGELKLFRQFEVVNDVEDDALQVQLDELGEKGHGLKVGDFYQEQFPIEELGRAAALLAKQVLKQKIREAEKQSVYDEYYEKIDEMIMGEVESVEDRFVLVNIGKTIALMPKAQQIPNEYYQEGQRIRVVIAEVNKETKGAQVIVSRGEASLVKRLFEKEVPEIFEGIVEIRAIARDPGERTKMAVYSANPDIDPIGACIGPRGSRVQVVIEELKGEKIDIFEWSENPIELIRNALAPAEVIAVFNNPNSKGLLAVVADNQLSLAIGKRGKNARLAVKLTKQKIDIKSQSEVQASGLDASALMAQLQSEIEVKIAERKAKQAQARLDQLEAQLQEVSQAETVDESVEDLNVPVEEVVEVMQPSVAKVDQTAEEVVVEEPAKVEKIKPTIVIPKRTIKQRQEYVSKFEELADASKKKAPLPPKKKKKYQPKEEEEDLGKRFNTSEFLSEIDYELKPIYTEEELLELEKDLDDQWYEEDDIDYDEFDDYYED